MLTLRNGPHLPPSGLPYNAEDPRHLTMKAASRPDDHAACTGLWTSVQRTSDIDNRAHSLGLGHATGRDHRTAPNSVAPRRDWENRKAAWRRTFIQVSEAAPPPRAYVAPWRSGAPSGSPDTRLAVNCCGICIRACRRQRSSLLDTPRDPAQLTKRIQLAHWPRHCPHFPGCKPCPLLILLRSCLRLAPLSVASGPAPIHKDRSPSPGRA
jgi:hypothetical protein